MPSESSRQRLPFEPGKNRKKQEKKSSSSHNPKVNNEEKPITANKSKYSSNQKRKIDKSENTIPDVVSRRMVSRMVLMSGIPLLLALLTFVISYFIITNEIFILPNQAVLLVSMGFFGLSVVGLSYGIFSTSWDEEQKGSLLGLQEFKTNFQRMRNAWQEAKSKN
ncbi:MAG: PAM68 family protein [Trichodesmium sp.]